MDNKRLAEKLEEFLGKDRVLGTPEERLVYSYDASRASSPPALVVLPQNTSEVSRLLNFAWENHIPVYPRGAGTGMTGASVPDPKGIALVMTAMNRILAIDTADLTVRVQPGVVLRDLKEAVKEKGFFYPPDPASARFATIGGTVAVNSGGLNGVKYGVTRDYVLSLEMVSASGEIMHFGAGTRKSVTGYDLTRLLVGSEGTLGVITEITLKLVPYPLYVETLLVAFKEDLAALDAALEVIRKPLVPSAMEFLDQAAVHSARMYTKEAFLEGAGGILLLEFDAPTPEASSEARQGLKRSREIFQANGAIRMRETSDPAERERLWEIRRCLSPAIYELAPTKRNEDICVPRPAMPEVIREIKRIASEHGIQAVNFAHAGDGNIHVNFMYDGEDEEQTRHAQKAVEELFRLTIEHGGTLSGEHGIGRTKARFLAFEYGAAERKIMRNIKKLFDPRGILNPGKIFSGDDDSG